MSRSVSRGRHRSHSHRRSLTPYGQIGVSTINQNFNRALRAARRASGSHHRSVTRSGHISLPFQAGAAPMGGQSATAAVVRAVARLGESSQHNDATIKYFTLSLGKPIKCKGEKSYYTHQQSWVTSSLSSGSQYAKDLFQIGNLYTQLVTGSSASNLGIGDSDSNQWAVNPFDLNPTQRVSGGTITNSSFIPRQDQAIWHSVSGEHQIMNGATVTCTFTIYYYTPKIAYEGGWPDSVRAPATLGPVMDLWGQSINNLINNQISAYDAPTQRIGGVNAPQAGNVVDTGVAYGTTPFRQRLVNKNIKILHTESHSLQPGSTKKIKFKIHMNKLLDKEVLTNFLKDSGSDQVLLLPKKSVCAFIVARAVPVKIESEVPGSAYTGCAPGPVELLHTMNYTCAYSYRPTTTKIYNEIVDYNYPNNPVQQQFNVNDTDDVVPVDIL